MSEGTQILNILEQEDSHAASQLLPLVYDQLRRLAGTHEVLSIHRGSSADRTLRFEG